MYRRNRLVHAVLFAVFAVVISSLAGRDAPPLSAQSSSRSYLLGMGGMQAVANGQAPFYKISTPITSMAADADMVYLHMELYGLPWSDFATSATPPASHPWTIQMNSFAQQNQSTGKLTYLGLFLGRQQLAQNAENYNGTLKMNDAWAPACYNFSESQTPGTDANTKRTAYLNYVQWMMTKFNPKYVSIAMEINDYWENCTNKGQPVAAWNAIVDVANAAYDTAKLVRTDAVVFPTFTANNLYGYDAVSRLCAKPMITAQCDTIQTNHYNAAYAAVAAFKRDRLAIAAWPYLAQTYSQSAPTSDGKRFMTVATIPTDYFTRAAARGGERALISETGWISDNLVIKPSATASCVTFIAGSQTAERDYISQVFSRAQSNNIDAIVWWSNRDALPQNVMTGCYPFATAPTYAACNGEVWCANVNFFRASLPSSPAFGEVIFKAWGTAGIKRYDGATKSSPYTRWKQGQAQPYVPVP